MTAPAGTHRFVATVTKYATEVKQKQGATPPGHHQGVVGFPRAWAGSLGGLGLWFVFWARSRVRVFTSRALMPFFAETICTMTVSHVDSETCEPWKIVPVRTLYCLRHLAHFHTRRTDCDRLPLASGIPGPRMPVLGLGLEEVRLLIVPAMRADGLAVPPEFFQQEVGVVLVRHPLTEFSQGQLHKPIMPRSAWVCQPAHHHLSCIFHHCQAV